ncbi:hypothetical protein C8046_05260 [Serinibacter arcticus]|uniref:Uncharacterized protein n=1 Tax=Serinibacter arcticus TaxID=1655435 RepID=A0A2U1ZTB6_9MICO|nr:hypothetical protein [Serinibacter arcticus]PWD50162.1 hypothetical protein C8046_05260 [Serinibacter arcticus]
MSDHDRPSSSPTADTSSTRASRDRRDAGVVLLAGLGIIAAAVALTFIPGGHFGSVWTYHYPQFDRGAYGAFSGRAFRANQTPLAIAAATAIVGVTLVLISTRLRGPRGRTADSE